MRTSRNWGGAERDHAEAIPLVSILTPVLNASKYLEQCIDSVLNQTYPNIEHVFADGGSTDGTLELLAKYSAEYPGRIKYVTGKDSGVGSALKKAYRISEGAILGWIDSDDLYEPNAVEIAVERFRKDADVQFLYGRCNLINAGGDVIGCFVIRDFDKKEWLNVWHYIVFCATFFRRNVIEKVGFVNDLGNDLYFYLKVGKKFKLVRIDQVLTNWRLHSDSISLKQADRESSIRWDRAKEDFFLVLKYRGSLLSPKSLIYYGHAEPSIPRWVRSSFFFIAPVLRRIDWYLKDSMYVAQRKGGSFTLGLLDRMYRDIVGWIRGRFSRQAYYENLLYNSASSGHEFCRSGQRFDDIRSGSVIMDVRIYMDKVGDPVGIGSCVVRKVSDDSIVGRLGSVDVATLPDASAPRPKWISFKEKVRIEQKGDYRIMFEWDNASGDAANYPRVRYNDSDVIRGCFTKRGVEGNWIDNAGADASIKIRID